MSSFSVMSSSVDMTWTTPKSFFDKVSQEFNFTLDAAAFKTSALCPNYYGPDHEQTDRRDALECDWVKDSAGGWIWLNPPYGRALPHFIKKAHNEYLRGAKIVILIPSRTGTSYWHDYLVNHEIRFIRGRLKFGNTNTSAPFDSALIIMGGNQNVQFVRQ